ncbi:hypothetical protein TI04_02890 [Achromatium sp. WMS2]|nr:hypothetical protein TI04_02890 [Achromatium sp. WMS2]
MSMLTTLIGFAVGQVFEGASADAWRQLQEYCTDSASVLACTIEKANAKTWRVLELALAEKSLGAWLQERRISGAEKGLLEPLRSWLDAQGPTFRNACLAQLQSAQQAGVFNIPNGSPLVAKQDIYWPENQDQALIQAQGIMEKLDGELRISYPLLARFLTGPDPHLVPKIFSYLLQQAVSIQPALQNLIHTQQLQRIWHEQTQAFIALEQWLTVHNEALIIELERIQADMAGLFSGQTVIISLIRTILERLPNEEARRGAVSARLSSVLRSTPNLHLLEESKARLATMTAAERTPEVLDAIGRLAMATGEFTSAQSYFQEAAQLAQQAGMEATAAEAHYNAYRALLEQGAAAWDEGLQELQAAIALDADSFAPCPMDEYALQKILGAGGFGVSFLCTDRLVQGLQVVVKALDNRALGLGTAEIFKEVEALWQINHPAIIRIRSRGYADTRRRQRPYLVMDYFVGTSLTQYVTQHGALSLEQATDLACLLAAALLAVHQRGILHRDLKPDNLLVRTEQNQWQIQLIDFGLAVTNVKIGLSNHSIWAQSVAGTLEYAAPEQWKAMQVIGPWSDVYAFGRLLCFTLFQNPQPTLFDWQRVDMQHNLVKLINHCLQDSIDPAKPGHRLLNFQEVLAQLPNPPTISPDTTEYTTKMQELVAKTRMLATQEEALQHQAADLNKQLAALTQQQQALQNREQEVTVKLKELATQEARYKQQTADLAQQQAELNTQQAQIKQKMAALADKEAKLQAQEAAAKRQKEPEVVESQREAEPAAQPQHVPRKLSPWNPLDYLRFMWAALVMPQTLDNYPDTDGKVAKWLGIFLVLLPFWILNFALDLGLLPGRNTPDRGGRITLAIIAFGLVLGFYDYVHRRPEKVVLFGDWTASLAAVRTAGLVAGLGIALAGAWVAVLAGGFTADLVAKVAGYGYNVRESAGTLVGFLVAGLAGGLAIVWAGGLAGGLAVGLHLGGSVGLFLGEVMRFAVDWSVGSVVFWVGILAVGLAAGLAASLAAGLGLAGGVAGGLVGGLALDLAIYLTGGPPGAEFLGVWVFIIVAVLTSGIIFKKNMKGPLPWIVGLCLASIAAGSIVASISDIWNGLIYTVNMFIASSIILGIFALVGKTTYRSINTKTPSWIVRTAFFSLMTNYSFLIYFYLLGGWRLFSDY